MTDTTHPTTPDQGDERRAIHEWLMREHKIEVLGNPEDDTAAVISLGTLRNIARVAISAAQPGAQEAIPPGYALISIDALRAWGKLDEVRDACKYPLAAPQPSQGAEVVSGKEIHADGRASSVVAWSIGEACHKSLGQPSGDYIDRGLILLRELKARGLTIIKDATPHHPASAEAGKGVADAWLFTCKKPGTVMVYATIDPNDANHWPVDQWKSVVREDLFKRPSESVAVSGEVSELPTWDAVASKRNASGRASLTALELFIFDHEPAGEGEAEFRKQLSAVLALAGSAKEAAALERMARLDDEMGIEP